MRLKRQRFSILLLLSMFVPTGIVADYFRREIRQVKNETVATAHFLSRGYIVTGTQRKDIFVDFAGEDNHLSITELSVGKPRPRSVGGTGRFWNAVALKAGEPTREDLKFAREFERPAQGVDCQF